MGTSTPYYYYTMSVAGNGIYFNNTNGRYLQISVAATGAPRIAGHNDQIVFYNSEKESFNSIQVSKVYNYSDARAKTNVRSLNNALDRQVLVRSRRRDEAWPGDLRGRCH